MVRCIKNVFQLLPPEQPEVPSRDKLSDATINIQSFLFNVFGSMDNLAWIWVSENGQKRADGTPIPNSQVGLWSNNASVRATLSEDFQKYLKELEPWFKEIGKLRHALAHRIPLYIPPYVIEKKDEAAYREFEVKMAGAIKGHNYEEYDRLSTEQLKLGRFRPWVQHSFEEGVTPIVFHAQMLSDFNTVDALGDLLADFFAELDADLAAIDKEISTLEKHCTATAAEIRGAIKEHKKALDDAEAVEVGSLFYVWKHRDAHKAAKTALRRLRR
jgi:hypothetical protein